MEERIEGVSVLTISNCASKSLWAIASWRWTIRMIIFPDNSDKFGLRVRIWGLGLWLSPKTDSCQHNWKNLSLWNTYPEYQAPVSQAGCAQWAGCLCSSYQSRRILAYWCPRNHLWHQTYYHFLRIYHPQKGWWMCATWASTQSKCECDVMVIVMVKFECGTRIAWVDSSSKSESKMVYYRNRGAWETSSDVL